jgi:pantetheine-phosphate adenylyltransferase
LIGAAWIVRGLRSIGDLEDEWAMALTNRAASGGIIDTVFIPSRPEFSHIRARLVKEIAVGGGRLSGLVPDRVALEIENALQKSRPKRGR